MIKTEIFDFLELPDSATEQEVITRLADKHTYFTNLEKNAPTDFLRKLHTRNLEKIEAIQNQYGFSNKKQGNFKGTSLTAHKNIAPRPHHSNTDNVAVAWLIKHTENKAAKHFAIYNGENIIGRNALPGKQMILIDDDPYISRVHALLFAEITSQGYEFCIVDNAIGNGGKASKNGTYINADDTRIDSKAKLSPNDTIQVGTTKLILRLNNENVKQIIHEVEETDYMKTVVINIF